MSKKGGKKKSTNKGRKGGRYGSPINKIKDTFSDVRRDVERKM